MVDICGLLQEHMTKKLIFIKYFYQCRKRKIRKNTTKGWTPKDLLPGSPVPTREQIMQESPGIVTRGRLALLMEEGASQDISPPTVQPSTLTKKMTPKRAKRSLDI